MLTPDQRADRLAAGQYGLITRTQARRAGLSARQIEWRLASGRWVLVGLGLYRVASVPVGWQQRALAPCLLGPPGTVVSNLTAAAVHDLTTPPARPHITMRRGTSGRSRIAIVHRVDLSPRDRLRVAGIPCTGVARTLLDCAGTVKSGGLAHLVDAAFCAGLSHPRAVADAIDRANVGRGRRRVEALRHAISVWSPGIEPGSPAEMRLLRQIRDWGFEPPQRQVEVFDDAGCPIGRVDLGWPVRRVGLEYDSDEHHNPRHWARDEGRHPRYRNAGWHVHRVDKHDLRAGQPRLRRLLDALLLRPAA
ncbi:MAG: type IV toxin-antitoxin system AbiEi family antitoxin domain-containing protein [Acidimicrobiales bacterium]